MRENKAKEAFFFRAAVILTLLIWVCLLGCLIVAPAADAQTSKGKTVVKPAPTPEATLDEDEAAELIEELKESLAEELEDEDTVAQIVEKWDADELVGKTRKEALKTLFAVVEEIVDDEEIAGKLWESWNSGDGAKTEGVEPVLDDRRKRDIGLTEMGFFGWTRTVRFDQQPPYSFKNQRYTIHTDPADPDSKFKTDAIKKAVELIINKGLLIPDGLQFFCSRHGEAQNRAFMRDERWNPVAYITLRWGTDTPTIRNSLSAKGFSGYERSTISMVHEIGHILHERNAGDAFFHAEDSIIQDRSDPAFKAAAARVSGYAQNSKKEFVAEVFTGLIFGMKFHPDVMAEYEKYRGPRIR